MGAVKLAPTLPFDGNFPYLHLERKFMHLGFHIYDVSMQSPNVEAAKPKIVLTSVEQTNGEIYSVAGKVLNMNAPAAEFAVAGYIANG